MAENKKWTNDPPKEVGFYWCRQNGDTRMVKVWAYKINNPPTKFYTNEDGGASILDSMYVGAKWFGPIVPPDI